MNARIALAFLALPLLVGLERLAYYGHRSVLFLHLMSLAPGGTDTASELAAAQFQRFSLWLLFGLIVGGGLASVATPRGVLVLGALLTAAGYFLLSATGASAVLVVLGVIALGQGLFKPGLWAAAGDEISHLPENWRNLLFVLVYATVNLGALLATPLGAGLAGQSGERQLVFVAAGGLMVLATAVAAGLLVLHFVADRLPPRPAPWKVFPGVIVVFLLAAPAQLLLGQLFELQFRALRPFEALDLLSWVNPAAVLGACGLLTVLLAITGALGFHLRTAVLIGIGALLLAASAAPYLGPLLDGTFSRELAEPVLPQAAVVLTMVVAAIGEVLLGFTVARMVTGVHARLAGALAALWFVFSWAGFLLPTLEDGGAWVAPLVSALTGAALFGGAALLALNGVLQRTYFEAPAAPTKADAVARLG